MCLSHFIYFSPRKSESQTTILPPTVSNGGPLAPSPPCDGAPDCRNNMIKSNHKSMSDVFSYVNFIQHAGLVNEVNDLMSFGNLVKVAVVTRLQPGRITLKGYRLLDCAVEVGLLGLAAIAASKLLLAKKLLTFSCFVSIMNFLIILFGGPLLIL
jgi:hypothetical protein